MLGWHLSFRRVFNDEAEEIDELWSSLDNISIAARKMESIVWTASKSKKFSVKSFYKLLERQIDLVEENWLCEMFWKTRASPKAVCFRWIAAKNSCFTQDVLQQRLFFYAIDASYVNPPANTHTQESAYSVWTVYTNLCGMNGQFHSI